jgi:drug/metabolite transporter (DMT)-like permease
LSERLSWLQIIGGIIVLSAVFITSTSNIAKNTAEKKRLQLLD